MTERFNIRNLLASRSGQRSYHVASEQHVCIEFRNMADGETVEPFTYSGDVVVTCYRGLFSIAVGAEAAFQMGEFDQVVIPAGKRVQVECMAEGTIQTIWSPAQASTVKG